MPKYTYHNCSLEKSWIWTWRRKLANGHRPVRVVTVNLKILLLFVPRNVTDGSGGAASQRVQRTPVSVFLPVRLSFDDKRRAGDSKPLLFPESRRQRAFQRARVGGPTQPARHPVAKGTAAVSAATEIVAHRSNSLPVHNLCRVKLLDRKIKREEGIERKEEAIQNEEKGMSYDGRRRGGGGGERRVLLLSSFFQLKQSQELPPSDRGRKAWWIINFEKCHKRQREV